MYGPVRTVVWQGSAGDRCPYADQNRKGEIKTVREGDSAEKTTVETAQFRSGRRESEISGSGPVRPLRASPHNRYLFETRHCGPFTPRRVQQIVQAYRRRAGLDQRVHPHLFRHQMLSHLTAQGLSDAQIQLISGHESKRSLEVYQHLSLEQVERAYQAAVRDLDV